jgi:dienelactone hydrolase
MSESAHRPVREESVSVVADSVQLEGALAIPEGARSVVLFAHGSGSSRLSPRNRFVAAQLQRAGFATLLFDLLTPDEEALDALTRHLRFDIALLAERVIGATQWLEQHPLTRGLRVGYFGASTGGAAALVAAARLPEAVDAIVSRGGRPDLAEPHLVEVLAPTLLVVGELDTYVLELNRQALARLKAPSKLVVIPRASHLFEEPGALEQVAKLACEWFQAHLPHA